MEKENEKNKKLLDEIDEVLVNQLEYFKNEIIQDLDKLSERFIENQVKYSKDVINNSKLKIILKNAFRCMIIGETMYLRITAKIKLKFRQK